MVDLELLADRARRTAERSRVRMAARIALVIAPLIAVGAVAGASLAACACLGGALFLLAVALRWRDRLGVEAVRDGLLLGAVPAAVAVLLRGCGVRCAPLGAFGEAEWACLAAGVVAGVGVTLLAIRSTGPRRRRWLLRLLVASMTASLGCAGLGIPGVVATLAALVATASIVWLPLAFRAT